MYRLPKAICKEKDCLRIVKSHGWCQLHWRRIKATGSPYATLRTGAKPRHGDSKGAGPTTEYIAWQSMKQRCYYTKHVAYKRYGGRGIRVCSRWLVYENFLADMGRRPKGKTIDRIDNDGNYEPKNVRWASMREQNLNKSDATKITVDGVTKSVTEWAEHVGLQRKTIYQRLRKGWAHDKAVLAPVAKWRRR